MSVEEDRFISFYSADYSEKLILKLAEDVGLPVGYGIVREGIHKLVDELHARGMFIGAANDEAHATLVRNGCARGKGGLKNIRLIKEETHAVPGQSQG